MLTQNQSYLCIVLAAGFGTRLSPLTHLIPKPLVPLGPKPILMHLFQELWNLDPNSTIHVNTHYLRELFQPFMREYLSESQRALIRLWEEPTLLNTGGGIKRIHKALIAENPDLKNSDVLVISGDIFSDFDLEKFLSHWEIYGKPLGAKALMAMEETTEPRQDYAWVNKASGKVTGFGVNGPQGSSPKLFNNYQIIDGNWLAECTDESTSSINNIYKPALIDPQGPGVIYYQQSKPHFWYNLGTPKELYDCLLMHFPDYTSTGLVLSGLNLSDPVPQAQKKGEPHLDSPVHSNHSISYARIELPLLPYFKTLFSRPTLPNPSPSLDPSNPFFVLNLPESNRTPNLQPIKLAPLSLFVNHPDFPVTPSQSSLQSFYLNLTR